MPGSPHETQHHTGEHGETPEPSHYWTQGHEFPHEAELAQSRFKLLTDGKKHHSGDHDVTSYQAHQSHYHELPFKRPHHEAPVLEIVPREPIHHEPWQKGAAKHPASMPALHREKQPKEKMERHYATYPDEHSYRRLPTEDEPVDIAERMVHEK